MPNTYVQLGADTGIRANENPINPAAWRPVVLFGGAPNQIVGNEICGTTTAGVCSGFFIGAKFPEDQWAEIQVDAINTAASSGNSFWIGVRNSLDESFRLSDYVLQVNGPIGGGTFNLQVNSRGGVLATTPVVINAGSKVRIEAFENFITCWLDGVLKITYEDTSSGPTYPSAPQLQINDNVTPATDVQLSNFKCGSISRAGALSSVDSRVAPNTNTTRSVQGTLIDDVPSTISHPVPQDSRSAGNNPLDSRLPANIPENSRNSS